MMTDYYQILVITSIFIANNYHRSGLICYFLTELDEVNHSS